MLEADLHHPEKDEEYRLGHEEGDDAHGEAEDEGPVASEAQESVDSRVGAVPVDEAGVHREGDHRVYHAYPQELERGVDGHAEEQERQLPLLPAVEDVEYLVEYVSHFDVLSGRGQRAARASPRDGLMTSPAPRSCGEIFYINASHRVPDRRAGPSGWTGVCSRIH